MENYEILVLLVVGIISGMVNTIAGGGSLLTLPILIFLGLPPSIANGTNRIQLIFQNIFAVYGFKSKGISNYKFSSWLSFTAILGSLLGAKIAIDFPEELFKKVLSVIMIFVMITIFLKKNNDIISDTKKIKNKTLSILLFFFVGLYGGFIHAGVGFLMILILSGINNLKLSHINSCLLYTSPSPRD